MCARSNDGARNEKRRFSYTLTHSATQRTYRSFDWLFLMDVAVFSPSVLYSSIWSHAAAATNFSNYRLCLIFFAPYILDMRNALNHYTIATLQFQFYLFQTFKISIHLMMVSNYVDPILWYDLKHRIKFTLIYTMRPILCLYLYRWRYICFICVGMCTFKRKPIFFSR